MPKTSAKNKLKKKQKKAKKGGKKDIKQKPNVDEKEEKKQDGGYVSGKKALLKKYDIRLGPKGYIPAASGTPKSIHIDEFSMVDPGGGRELLTKTSINIKENSIYGLVGKNGFGKTTLLKLMYNYEIEGFPNHIRMVIVNQEELFLDDGILQAVLAADEIRSQLIKTEDRLNLMSEQMDDEQAQEEINEILKLSHVCFHPMRAKSHFIVFE